MKKVERNEFDRFLHGKKFTTKTISREKKLIDKFYINGRLVAEQECHFGNIQYFLDEKCA